MHYEYQHAGLERSQPSSSEQNMIKGMDIRAALDRSGFGNKANNDKNQKLYELDQVNKSGSVIKSSQMNANRGVQSNDPYKSNFSGYDVVQNSGFKEPKNQNSGFGESNRQQSGIRSSGFAMEEYGERLDSSEVKKYDQSGMRNNQGGYGTMNGSEYRPNNYQTYQQRGGMQGSSFGGNNSNYYGDTRNPSKGGYQGQSYSRNKQFQMSSMRPSNMGQGSSFQYSESGRMQKSNYIQKQEGPNKALNPMNSVAKHEEKITDVLDSFNEEEGYYKTIDLINFLAHHSMTEDSPEDKFLMHQLHRNMKNSFKQFYIPSQFEDLATHSRYIGSGEGIIDDEERKALYSVYLQYLKENGREFQLSNDQKREEFDKILKNMRSR